MFHVDAYLSLNSIITCILIELSYNSKKKKYSCENLSDDHQVGNYESTPIQRTTNLSNIVMRSVLLVLYQSRFELD
jgi:hypothetical protein